MNKRIRELALQAGIDFLNCTNPEHGDREYCEAWIEQQQKFAELIVRECAKVIIDNEVDYPITGAVYDGDRAKAIMKHFGVE